MKSRLVCELCLVGVLAIGLASPMPLRALTVKSADIAPADGTSGQVLTTGNGVKTGHIQNLAVTGAKIAAGTITTGNIGSSQITNALLTPNAVTTDKIQDGAVGTADLADGAVTDAKITGPISASKISTTGLNADTVDGMHASAFAPATHTHAQADVTGLAASLAGKSDVTHTHQYGKVAIVAQSGGDYSDPVDAMSNIALWCGTPSSSNPCLLKIMPGVYDLGSQSLQMQEYVDVEGSGENTTAVTSSAAYTFGGASNTEIRFITIINAGTGWGAAGININAASPKLTNITVMVNGCSTQVYGIHSSGASSLAVMNNVTVKIWGGTETNVIGIFNESTSTIMNNVSVNISGSVTSFAGSIYGVLNNSASSTMTNVTVTISGSGTFSCAVHNSNGSSVGLSNSTFIASGTITNSAILNFGSSVTLNNVTAIGKNGSANFGMSNQQGNDIQADRSTFEGSYASISSPDGILKIGSSKLVNTVIGSGTITCVGSYNGSYMPLNANCQ